MANKSDPDEENQKNKRGWKVYCDQTRQVHIHGILVVFKKQEMGRRCTPNKRSVHFGFVIFKQNVSQSAASCLHCSSSSSRRVFIWSHVSTYICSC